MSQQALPPVSRPWWALGVAFAALAAGVWLLATPAESGPAGADAAGEGMLAVAPGGTVGLASLPAEHQELYEAAAADSHAFEAVACYCGCEAFLDHRHLGDCFVRPDGGWERHATGCGVCLSEARDVAAWRSSGTPIDEVSRRIDERYGAITTPTT